MRRQVHICSYQRLFAVVERGKRRENILCGGDILFAAHAEHIASESAVIVAGGESGAGEYRAERALVFGGAFARETLFAGSHCGGNIFRPLHASLYFERENAHLHELRQVFYQRHIFKAQVVSRAAVGGKRKSARLGA